MNFNFFRFAKLIITGFVGVTFASLPNGACAQESAVVTLYTEEFRPYNFTDENGKIRGTATAIVKRIMEETKLPYKIRSLHWTRTVREAGLDKRGLIFSLFRSEERESKFHWLAAVARPDFRLFARTDDMRTVTTALIKAGTFSAVCVIATASCHMLRKAGFPEEKLFKIAQGVGVSTTGLLEYGRVDFYSADLKAHRFRKGEAGFTEGASKPVLRIGSDIVFYLAAGRHVDKTLIAKIRSATATLKAAGELSPDLLPGK
ncbi:MAG: hypothetical protein JKY60_11910 [Kordiimonadaceae bacterium]|nr:hypothetical protein [Kordiimonadaceae bacterium]